MWAAGLLSRCAEDGAAGDAVGGDEALWGDGGARRRGVDSWSMRLRELLAFRRGG